ncbi:MAG: hypothetical protein V4671_19090 [Armatimonadota bacterium]
MIRSTRTILLLAAFWLVTLTAPAAAAVTGWTVCALPALQTAKGMDGERAVACPMKQSARHSAAPCCCCGVAVAAKTHSPRQSHTAVISDLLPSENCACSFTPVSPAAQQPENVVVLPLFSALALLVTPASAPIAAPSLMALPNAPIRGPATALLRTPILAPDAGRAPPTAV